MSVKTLRDHSVALLSQQEQHMLPVVREPTDDLFHVITQGASTLLKTRASMDLQHSVGRNHSLVVLGTELRRALLRGKIHIMDAEALGIAIGPLEVIEQTPQEVALDWKAFLGGTQEVSDVIAQIHHTVDILDAPLCIGYIVRRAAV